MTSITKFHRDVVQHARDLCRAAGGDCHIEAGSGKHRKLVIQVGAVTRMTPLAGSPTSDHGDALRMKLCDVRRILRKMAE